MAVSIVVWLAAFVTTNTGDSRNVDIVALALAFPGGLAIWLSMSTSADVGSFRSIRGRISMGASACISLMAILLYMVYPSAMYPRYVWHGGRLFFLLYDPLWSALLGLSVANFLLIVLSFAVALRRYRTLLKP
jgi:hypothetical protein